MLHIFLYDVAMSIRGKFTEHPASVDETYLEHMRVAAGFSSELAKAAFCAAIHAVFPWRHCTTASTKVHELQAKMTAGARAQEERLQHLELVTVGAD